MVFAQQEAPGWLSTVLELGIAASLLAAIVIGVRALRNRDR